MKPVSRGPLAPRGGVVEPTRAVVLVPVLRHERARQPTPADAPAAPTPSRHAPADRLNEATGLAAAINLNVTRALVVPVPVVSPGKLFGKGKVEEIRAIVEEDAAVLVIIDHAITPVQQRNLEEKWQVKVLDRTGLILEIFGARAQTREGRLQVELAHLQYQKGRLVRAWTHLERQRGGRGFLGGPGEAQIELDRRILQDRVDALEKELDVVVRTRALHRKGRNRRPYPIVAIVGYTNAGKSTLFNRLTGAGVLAVDQVFATLDPTMREVKLASGRRFILSDTVGFISDLPTSLIAAFRATLEEVIEADLILHVRDIAAGETEAQARDVEAVLRDLGIDITGADANLVEVWNKIDLLTPERREEALNAARFGTRSPVATSAVTGEGLAALLAAIETRLGAGEATVSVRVPGSDGALLHWIYENATVVERTTDDEGVLTLVLRIADGKRARLDARIARASGTP